MNREGKLRCEAFQDEARTELELQDEITRTRMMSLLCHCSAEIDSGTLLYFSVHNMYLGSGDFILLLFSEISAHSEEQEAGLDVYSRMYVYRLIEEEVHRVLAGHMTLYTAELDGRLVGLVQFQFGLLPALRSDLVEMIGNECTRIAENCRERYDIQVVAYISDVMDQISILASTYHKMLSVATLHRYTRRRFNVPYYRLFRPEPGAVSPIRVPIRERAGDAAQAIAEQGDYRGILSDILLRITEQPFQSIDELKRYFGDLFEALCEELQLRGVRLNVAQLRREEMALIMEDTDWQRPCTWLLELADSISAGCRGDQQASLKLNLNRVRNYIGQNLTDPALTVKSIADATGISTTALSGMFRHQMKTTPARYIREQRLELARELLQTTNLTMQEITERCGFGSLETFHRVFKEAYGITPGKLRRISAQTEDRERDGFRGEEADAAADCRSCSPDSGKKAPGDEKPC